jgi:hypothetical protein
MEEIKMPKRIIDGDNLWVSEKLSTVSERYRVEYAWILPLAQVNGCFECSPMLVWRTCYSALRTNWTTDDVAAMLDAFEVAKMLFRFQIAGKTYGFFPGVQKSGRLPKPSERIKYAAPWNKGMVPAKELAKFLGLTARDVTEEYGELVASKSRVGRESVESRSPTGNGIGIGVGSGGGDGSGYGVGNGTGDGGGAAIPNTTSPMASLLTSPLQDSNTQHDNTASPRSNTSSVPSEEEDDLDTEFSPVTSPEHPVTASDFVETFRLAIRSNPHASDPPTGWEKMWREDFTTMLALVSPVELYDILVVSQVEKYQKYYVRTNRLLANLELLQQMVTEREKVLPALRVEFRKKLASPISAEEERNELEDDDDDLA